jgi:site-specific recombinase XerD
MCIINNSLLPVLSNQKMNAYLKEIADLCGIQNRITTHTGRHTYATTVALPNGVPMEVISINLGHSNTFMTGHYAKVGDNVKIKYLVQINSVYSASLLEKNENISNFTDIQANKT